MKRWQPFNKGGGYKKWYGNNDYVISFDKESIQLLLNMGNHLPSRHLYFKKGITWNAISSGSFCVREHIEGSIFSNAGMVCICKDEDDYLYLHTLLNSIIPSKLLSMLSPTLNFNAGDIKRLPIIKKAVRK